MFVILNSKQMYTFSLFGKYIADCENKKCTSYVR